MKKLCSEIVNRKLFTQLLEVSMLAIELLSKPTISTTLFSQFMNVNYGVSNILYSDVCCDWQSYLPSLHSTQKVSNFSMLAMEMVCFARAVNCARVITLICFPFLNFFDKFSFLCWFMIST